MSERERDAVQKNTDWEDFIADIEKNRQKAVIQTVLAERIVFPYKAETYSEFVQSFTAASESEKRTRFPINISNLEVVLPFLWGKEGWVKGLKEREPNSNEQHTKASIIGSTLHELDALFNVVAQNSGGILLGQIMPTVRDKKKGDKKLTRYQKITEGIEVDINTPENLKNAFSQAIDKRREIGGLVEGGTPSLFGEIPLRNPSFEKHFVYEDSGLKTMEKRLADFWVKQMFKDVPLTWEFMNSKVAREAFVIISFSDLPLQIKGKLDSVSRRPDAKGKDNVWVVDLKTGRAFDGSNPVEAEILKRQMQTYVFMAERLTAKQSLMDQTTYLSNKSLKSSLKRRQGDPFHFSASAQNKKILKERLHRVSIRRFNPTTGGASVEDMEFGDEEREEYTDWLAWLAQGTLDHKEELNSLIKSGRSYDLSSVKLDIGSEQDYE